MNYVFQFNVVWEHFPELLTGAWLTIQLSATAMVLGLCLAGSVRMARPQGQSRSAGWSRAMSN